MCVHSNNGDFLLLYMNKQKWIIIIRVKLNLRKLCPVWWKYNSVVYVTVCFTKTRSAMLNSVRCSSWRHGRAFKALAVGWFLTFQLGGRVLVYSIIKSVLQRELYMDNSSILVLESPVMLIIPASRMKWLKMCECKKMSCEATIITYSAVTYNIF